MGSMRLLVGERPDSLTQARNVESVGRAVPLSGAEVAADPTHG